MKNIEVELALQQRAALITDLQAHLIAGHGNVSGSLETATPPWVHVLKRVDNMVSSNMGGRLAELKQSVASVSRRLEESEQRLATKIDEAFGALRREVGALALKQGQSQKQSKPESITELLLSRSSLAL